MRLFNKVNSWLPMEKIPKGSGYQEIVEELTKAFPGKFERPQ